MSERTAIIVKLIAANLGVGLVLGLLRQTLLAVFNPHVDLEILTRFTVYGLQPVVLAAVTVFSLVASGIQLFLLRPLLRRLSRTEPEDQLAAEYVAARSSALRIPWVLIMLHVGIWIIGTTLIYAIVYRFDAPGGIPYHWSLTVAVASGLITGVMTALLSTNMPLSTSAPLLHSACS